MKKQKLMWALTLLCLLSCYALASAAPLTINYTADNVVQTWFVVNNTVTQYTPGPNFDEWWLVDSLTLDLNPHQTHQIIWQTENTSPNLPSQCNPGGFLAEIDFEPGFFTDRLVSSKLWEVAFVPSNLPTPNDLNNLYWTEATEWGRNDDSLTIWSRVHNGPVAGISGDAQWIWTANNFCMTGAPQFGDRVYIKATIPGVSAVPEPSSVALLILGLLNMAGLAKLRKFGVKS